MIALRTLALAAVSVALVACASASPSPDHGGPADPSAPIASTPPPSGVLRPDFDGASLQPRTESTENSEHMHHHHHGGASSATPSPPGGPQ